MVFHLVMSDLKRARRGLKDVIGRERGAVCAEFLYLYGYDSVATTNCIAPFLFLFTVCNSSMLH